MTRHGWWMQTPPQVKQQRTAGQLRHLMLLLLYTCTSEPWWIQAHRLSRIQLTSKFEIKSKGQQNWRKKIPAFRSFYFDLLYSMDWTKLTSAWLTFRCRPVSDCRPVLAEPGSYWCPQVYRSDRVWTSKRKTTSNYSQACGPKSKKTRITPLLTGRLCV